MGISSPSPAGNVGNIPQYMAGGGPPQSPPGFGAGVGLGPGGQPGFGGGGLGGLIDLLQTPGYLDHLKQYLAGHHQQGNPQQATPMPQQQPIQSAQVNPALLQNQPHFGYDPNVMPWIQNLMGGGSGGR